jgi:choline dehydrogenase-like flavoprotein
MAAATGRLVCRQGAIVSEIRIGPDGRAAGVNWRDRATGADMKAGAPIVFVCASALESTRILLLSRSTYGEPIGSRSGVLGTCLMDHVIVSADGTSETRAGAHEPFVQGRSVYLPRFDLRDPRASGSRGYGVQIHRWSLGSGRSHFTAVSFGEMAPSVENRVVLDIERKDAWGLPVLRIACRHSEAELQRARDQSAALRDMLFFV